MLNSLSIISSFNSRLSNFKASLSRYESISNEECRFGGSVGIVNCSLFPDASPVLATTVACSAGTNDGLALGLCDSGPIVAI